VAQILLNGVALAAALLTPAATACAQTAQATIAAEIHPLLAVADAFDRAQLAKDAAALDRMVADDLVFIDSSGKRSGKQAFIAGWTAPGDRFDPVTLVDRQLVALGPDAFLVTAETVLAGVSDGTRFASAFRFTDIFRKVDGRWRAVHIQVTRRATT
jgi:ketosteroid isomerase-like protein